MEEWRLGGMLIILRIRYVNYDSDSDSYNTENETETGQIW